MSKPKIWKIKNYEGTFTDDEIITLIKKGQIKGNFRIMTKELKEWIKVEDSIYQFYLEGEKDENI